MKRVIGPLSRPLAHRQIDEAPDGHTWEICEPTRNSEQNRKLWACLGDVAKQVVWYGRRLSSEDWKHIFTSSLQKMDVVPNLEGTGFVALGLSTSKMSRREMADLITLIGAFGDDRAVVWSEPKGAT